jgi:hypothetical protein
MFDTLHLSRVAVRLEVGTTHRCNVDETMLLIIMR